MSFIINASKNKIRSKNLEGNANVHPKIFSKKIHKKKLQIQNIYINSNQSWFYNQHLKKKN
jgi:hypothetical protein